MTINDVKDHAHEWGIAKTTEHPDLNGKTIIKVCRYDDCDGKRVEWQDKPEQATLL